MLKANSRADVQQAAQLMRNYPVYLRASAMLHIHGNRLMTFHPQDLTIRFFNWITGGRFSKVLIMRLPPEEIAHMWRQTIDHIVSGKDTEDRDSVGGWSQREMDIFYSIINRHNQRA